MLTFIVLYAVMGLLTLALVMLASIVLEHRKLERHEIVLTFMFWPVFLALLIARLDKP